MESAVTHILAEALAMLDEEIATARATMDRLTLERQGVEAAIKRFQDKPMIYSSVSSEPAPNGEASSLDEQELGEQAGSAESSETLGLTGQALDLLRAADHPLSIAEIVEGTSLDATQARSAMGYLRRKGEVHNVGRGLWQATTSLDAETAPAVTGAVSDTPHAHMKGGSAHGTVSDSVRNLDSHRQAVNRDHRDGASVVEALG